MFGDKVKKRRSEKAGIPVIPGSDGPVDSVKEVEKFGEEYGYRLLLKLHQAAAAEVCGLSNERGAEGSL
ncbi:hypothetical protein ACEQPO_11915 [Bacillus sp. SL00103]